MNPSQKSEFKFKLGKFWIMLRAIIVRLPRRRSYVQTAARYLRSTTVIFNGLKFTTWCIVQRIYYAANRWSTKKKKQDTCIWKLSRCCYCYPHVRRRDWTRCLHFIALYESSDEESCTRRDQPAPFCLQCNLDNPRPITVVSPRRLIARGEVAGIWVP